jgi:hypothetical protein
MSLRTSALALSLLAVLFVLISFIISRCLTFQLPWTLEPEGYRDPRYDIESILPERDNLVLSHEVVGFQSPNGRLATCTRCRSLASSTSLLCPKSPHESDL